MNPRLIAFFLITLALSARADEPTSKPAVECRTARECLLRGNYERAATLYDEMGKKEADAVTAACGWAEVARQTGRYSAGIERLAKVKAGGERVPAWHTVLAELLAETGEYEKAIEHLQAALRIDESCHPARLRLGELQELLGRTSAARDTYQAFEDVMTGTTLPDRAEDLTAVGRGFYRYSTLTRHSDLVERTRHVLTEVFQESFEFVDSLYWPARLAAAELLLEKHQAAEAKEDFSAVLRQNARAADAMVGLGAIALEDWGFDDVQRQVDAALAVNPSHVGARVLLARMRMTERKYGEAAEAATAALKTNPNSIEALSVLAAATLRQGDGAASKAAEERVRKLNSQPAMLHQEIGVWLSAGRQYDDAEVHFKKAMEYAPTWSEPPTSLGQLYMETGEEDAARKTLEGAFALDSFNRHTHNVLELLDVLDKFARIETEHFIIKYDAKADAVVIPYLADSLEASYADVCKVFDFHPAKKTIIEMFPDHMGFSVRITGRPFIATVGACTGRVIAFTAPRGRPPFGRFNWSSVLRHEFTHTVTLGVTENRIPHWMTEGLAVHEEPHPRRWDVKLMLCTAYRTGGLFDLNSIDWGFMRPRKANDRQLAYAQSEWMVEYIEGRWGPKAITDLLRAFRERKTQAQAFGDVLKIEPAAFSKEFLAWAGKQIEKWGLPTDSVADPVELLEQFEEKEDDAGLAAKVAESFLVHEEGEQAQKYAEKALKLNEKEATALRVMCRCLYAAWAAEADEETKVTLGEKLHDHAKKLLAEKPDDAIAARVMGAVLQSRNQGAEAAEWYAKYQKRFPEDPETVRRIAGINLSEDKEDVALTHLERLSELVEEESAVMAQIAEIYLDHKQPAAAARWFRKALHVDPYDPETHVNLAEALLAAGDVAGAEKEFETVCRLQPRERIGYDGLSRVYKALGKPEKAAEYAARAEAADQKPETPDANENSN